VGEVGIHLDDALGPVLERPAEAGDVGGTEPFLSRSVQDGDVRQFRGEAIRQLARAVRRRVVDDEHAALQVQLREHVSELSDERLEVRALVIGRQADDQAHPRIIARVAQTLPSNAQLAEQLELLADLLELDGADAFRLSAYRRAATRIRESAVPVAQLALDKKATRLSGIGATIEAKIVEYTETGDLAALAKLRDKLPTGLVEVMHVPGLGPKTARKLWTELGVQSAADLRAAAEQGRLAEVQGLGPKTQEKVLASLAKPRKSIEQKTLLGRVLPSVDEAVDELRAHPAAVRVSEAGSVRRRCETVKDLDIIATADDPAALTAHFAAQPWVAEVVAHGSTKATVVSHDGLRFDLRVVPPESYGNLLQHFTGSKAHNVAMREEAVGRGLSISEYGVKNTETGEVCTAATEEELYEFLGYSWIPPELRENRGELAAAREGSLPELVELDDIKGDLHSHTTWSDGRAELVEMASAAKGLGRKYLAVCDHARRLRDGRLEAQAEEIAGVAAETKGLQILRGIEVDVRADGSLDTPDDILAGLDWVMASVHSGFDRARPELTTRIQAAMENPHVDCIGHPTGRKINRRDPYDVDFEALLEKAIETGTFLEINCQPDRLDLDDNHARAAAEAGVKLVISTDAHRVHELANTRLGVAVARRGWIGPDQVVNTRSWRDVKKLMKT
jgi:DNA polymerase (family 10)